MPKSCSKKPKSFTLQRQGKGNEEKTYIQVALELTLVKKFGLFLKVHKVLITSRFNDKILDDHFLVPVEHKTS